ncbi:unnamed protein product [Nezara viridula]|uniref:Uncharacterized protein n=1 Tax=Nezara viridula TaxID=85310 RepID=A0A9P0HQ37_NEZVI|nr:unnamed protein product [Nezara viridula]
MLVLFLLFGHVSCSHSTLVRKCCPLGQQWLQTESSHFTCGAANSTFRYPPIYSSLGILSTSKISLIYEPLNCAHLYSLLPDQVKEERYQILDSGRLLYLNGKFEEQFCLESDNVSTDPSVFVCVEDVPSAHGGEKEDVEFLLLSVGSGVSFLCLLALLFVYAIVEELQNNPGKFLMNHALAMALAYLVLFVNHIGGFLNVGDNVCGILGKCYFCKTIFLNRVITA